jgi:hypothetical protein
MVEGMRPPRQSIQFLVLLSAASFLACFALMIAGGFLPRVLDEAGPLAVAVTATRPAPTSTAPSPSTAQLAPAAAGVQKALLIIGVDDTTAAAHVLDGAWLVTYRTQSPEFWVLAFPPTARLYSSTLGAAHPLSEIYAYDRQLQLNGRLVQNAVQERFPGMPVESPVLLDRADFVRVAGALGGVKLGGRLMPALDVLASYDMAAATDADAGRKVLQQAFEALFVAMGEQGWTVARLATTLEEAGRLPDASAEVLDGFARDAPALTGALLFWHNYGPELELLNP